MTSPGTRSAADPWSDAPSAGSGVSVAPSGWRSRQSYVTRVPNRGRALLRPDQGNEGDGFEIVMRIVVERSSGHADQALEPVRQADRHDQPATDGELIEQRRRDSRSAGRHDDCLVRGRALPSRGCRHREARGHCDSRGSPGAARKPSPEVRAARPVYTSETMVASTAAA